MTPTATILLVEDNPDDFEATTRSLKRNQLTTPVRWCRNGKEALDYLFHRGKYADTADRSMPNLILLDLDMPGVDGRQVLETIKADQQLRTTPVVILTTSNDSRDVDQCYAIGANTYIQKPVNVEGLTQALSVLKSYWFGIALLPSGANRDEP